MVMKLFFKSLRIVLGPVMLLWERATRPKGMVRPASRQAEVDRQCQDLVLYQFRTCPFCIKVRQEMRRLSLDIERRDAQHDAQNRADLMAGLGAVQVPCLRITDAAGKTQWLKESGAIIAFLNQRFA